MHIKSGSGWRRSVSDTAAIWDPASTAIISWRGNLGYSNLDIFPVRFLQMMIEPDVSADELLAFSALITGKVDARG